MKTNKHRHLTYLYLEFREKKLPESIMNEIERHLSVCPECEEYFQKMDLLFNVKNLWKIIDLEPDPYLPSKVTMLMSNNPRPGRKQFRPRLIPLTVGTAALALAVSLGIFLGKGIAPSVEKVDSTTIAATYIESFQQHGFGDHWGMALDSTVGGRR